MVQGTIDDLNADTRGRFAYSDTKVWDADRKTREFVKYDFDRPANNFLAATSVHASWGFFDFRRKGEAAEGGFQSVPVNWGVSSARKRAFFEAVRDMSGRQ
jgi:hypothetical protein